MKSKHLRNTGNEQEKNTMDLALDDEGDNDFVTGKEIIENSKFSDFNRKDTDKKIEGGQEEMDRLNKKYLCPISACTFFLCEKNTMSELDHLKVSHPHVNTQISFLVLE